MTTWDERMTRQPPRQARLELAATIFWVLGPSGRPLRCGLAFNPRKGLT
jgi:hypothetical protein